VNAILIPIPSRCRCECELQRARESAEQDAAKLRLELAASVQLSAHNMAEKVNPRRAAECVGKAPALLGGRVLIGAALVRNVLKA
jgi:hypothetical protein